MIANDKKSPDSELGIAWISLLEMKIPKFLVRAFVIVHASATTIIRLAFGPPLLLRKWAHDNDFKILRPERRFSFKSPFLFKWSQHLKNAVYRHRILRYIEVLKPDGVRQAGWILIRYSITGDYLVDTKWESCKASNDRPAERRS